MISVLGCNKSRLNALLCGMIAGRSQQPDWCLCSSLFSCWCFCWLLHAVLLTHSLNYVSNSNFSRIDIRQGANVFLIIQTRGWWRSICKLDVLVPPLEGYRHKQNKCDDGAHLRRWSYTSVSACAPVKIHFTVSSTTARTVRGSSNKGVTEVHTLGWRRERQQQDGGVQCPWWPGRARDNVWSKHHRRLSGVLAATFRWRHRGRQLILLQVLLWVLEFFFFLKQF